MREHQIPTSLAIRPQRLARPAAQPAYAAPVSAGSGQASVVSAAVNGNGSIDRQAGTALAVVDASGSQDPDRTLAFSMSAGPPDEPAHVTGSDADDGRRIAQNHGDDTVIFENRSAYSRYKSAFLPLDVNDDLTSYQWESGDLADGDEQERPPGSGAAGPRFTRLPYIVAGLRRLAWVWCAAGLIGALFGAAAFKAFPPARSTASTSILVTTNPADIPTAAILTEVALAQSRPVAELALSDLGFSQSQIASDLTGFLKAYTVTTRTESVITITVKAPSSTTAENAANALASAYLQYRKNMLQSQEQGVLAALQQKISQAEQDIAAIGTQISQVQTLPASPAEQARLSDLKNQRSQQEAELQQLEQTISTNQATTEAATESMVRGTYVLNVAAPTVHSRLKVALIYVAGGLIAGLLIGLIIVVIRTLASDRLRWRGDITQALAAPVRLSVGTVRVRRWLPGKYRFAVTRDSEVRRVVSYLRTVVYGRGISGLALISVDNEDVAAAALVALALSCAQEGKRVLVADLSDGARAARLLGTGGAGIRTVTVDEQSLLVAIPDPYAAVPVGPLDHTPGPALPAASEELAAAYHSADLMFTLVTLDPSMGTEHLPTWASDAVVLVTAGQSSATRIHAVGELIRRSGTRLVSAVLVGADKSDETLGMSHAAGQLALTDQNGWER
jgi:capsular polysaccharide biosynthesis protein